MNNLSRLKARQGENGSALVIGIVFLLVLTILGLVGMQGSILQERMTGNTRDRYENFLFNGHSPFRNDHWKCIFMTLHRGR
jgi:Tfp pilus assembly protein PilX